MKRWSAGMVDRTLRSAYFSYLEQLRQAYGLETWRTFNTINRPFYIGIALYQQAKLRKLAYYSDFFYWYFDRRHFKETE